LKLSNKDIQVISFLLKAALQFEPYIIPPSTPTTPTISSSTTNKPFEILSDIQLLKECKTSYTISSQRSYSQLAIGLAMIQAKEYIPHTIFLACFIHLWRRSFSSQGLNPMLLSSYIQDMASFAQIKDVPHFNNNNNNNSGSVSLSVFQSPTHEIMINLLQEAELLFQQIEEWKLSEYILTMKPHMTGDDLLSVSFNIFFYFENFFEW
jgi:hypothetical protein